MGVNGRSGLTPLRGEVRTHALRHSLAMDLLSRGASLEEIGDVLRHRSRDSTTVYARYDVEALRLLARPWPVSGAGRLSMPIEKSPKVPK